MTGMMVLTLGVGCYHTSACNGLSLGLWFRMWSIAVPRFNVFLWYVFLELGRRRLKAKRDEKVFVYVLLANNVCIGTNFVFIG